MSLVQRRSRWFKPFVFALFGTTWAGAVATLIRHPPIFVEPTWSVWGPLSAGGAMGATLYFIALRRVVLPLGPFKLPFTRLLPVAAVVTVQAIAEEIVFRGSMLPAMISELGNVAALFLSTGAFAAAHYPIQGRAGFKAHVVTGSGFGVLFLVTHGVLASAVAHGLYNVLIIAERSRLRIAKRSGALTTRVA